MYLATKGQSLIDRSQSDRILLDNLSEKKSGRDPREVTPADLEGAGHFPDKLTAIIRGKCIDCCGGSLVEVKCCTVTDCNLWPYRMGTNPFRKRTLTETQREAVKERLSKARGAMASNAL